MSHRGPKDWKRDAYPLSAIRIRTKNRSKVRFIKTTHLGPKPKRWKPLARHWWEKNKGPVPEGMRVVHADGDTLNDDPSNYKLMTGGEVVKLYLRVRSGVMEKMRKKCSSATAGCNRERGQINRLIHWLPTRWYVVDRARLLIFNHPRRQLHQALQLCGLAVDSKNWRWHRRIARDQKLPFEVLRGREIAVSDDFKRFHKTDAFPMITTAITEAV